MIQISILKIREYGPWTLTLGSDREHELQMLQASLYREIHELFSKRNCIVFLNRCDEFFVVSNELKLDDHIQIQQSLEKSFDVRLTVSVGYAASPFEANLRAYEGRKSKVLLNEKHDIFGFISDGTDSNVSIMHLDVDNLSSRRNTDSPYEISSMIFELYSKMSKFFIKNDSLAFFLGGDNFMVVASDKAKNSVRDFIAMVKRDNGISLNCGIGTAKNSREAVRLATKSLDTIREIRDSGKEKPEVFELSC